MNPAQRCSLGMELIPAGFRRDLSQSKEGFPQSSEDMATEGPRACYLSNQVLEATPRDPRVTLLEGLR
jgi:hypothetical protein